MVERRRAEVDRVLVEPVHRGEGRGYQVAGLADLAGRQWGPNSFEDTGGPGGVLHVMAGRLGLEGHVRGRGRGSFVVVEPGDRPAERERSAQ